MCAPLRMMEQLLLAIDEVAAVWSKARQTSVSESTSLRKRPMLRLRLRHRHAWSHDDLRIVAPCSRMSLHPMSKPSQLMRQKHPPTRNPIVAIDDASATGALCDHQLPSVHNSACDTVSAHGQESASRARRLTIGCCAATLVALHC